MSVISSLPPEIIQNILCLLPPKEIATNYRFVCSQWNIASRELKVWHIAAESLELEYQKAATAKEIESLVAGLLLRREWRVSMSEKLVEKFNGCFSEIPSGSTRALCYRSSSNENAIGYFIATKDLQFNFEQYKGLGEDKDFVNIEKIKALFAELKGLTVIGSKQADYSEEGTRFSSTTNNDTKDQIALVYLQDLSQGLRKYFPHEDLFKKQL